MTNTVTDKLFSVDQAATAKFGSSAAKYRKRIYGWKDEGLSLFKIGGTLYVRESALNQFLADKEAAAMEAA